MPLNIQTRGKGHQLRVKHKLLPKGVWFSTFDSWEEAHNYGLRLEALLDSGIVPAELLLTETKSRHDVPLLDLVRAYRDGNKSISQSDRDIAAWIEPDIKIYRCSDVTFAWCQDLAKRLRMRPLAPSTIRARIGFLSRAWAWYHAHEKTGIDANPFSMMPEGYSVVTDPGEIAEMVKAGKKIKRDQQRERRLEPGEEDRIMAVLRGQKLRDDLERALEPNPEFELMFQIHINMGLRMRECYRLTRARVDLKNRVIHVQGTKGHRGAEKPRDVSILNAMHALLSDWISRLPEGEDRLFPVSWDGSNDPDKLRGTSNRLSGQWKTVFDHAMIEKHLTEHDLRHEATCRWVMLKKVDGQWALQPPAIAKLMGWSRLDMFQRYASLRGSDIADSLAGL